MFEGKEYRDFDNRLLNTGWPLNTVPLHTGSTISIYISIYLPTPLYQLIITDDDNDNVIKSYYQVHKKAPLVLKNESKYLETYFIIL